ncbi:preprotein translocase subunit SecG [Egbenema bharatensis]|uniref:preprotein translocase subunit SecG n=1 Tax=Egbenema bharatensis TaxID=3463334 RepID=UPI003A881E9F
MTLTGIVEILWAVSGLGLVILVLLHSPKGDGLGGLGGQAQLFTSTKSAEVTLNRLTWALTAVFMGLTVVLSAGWLTAAPPTVPPVPPVSP